MDSKRYEIKRAIIPKTVENKVKDILDRADTIQYHPVLSLNQILKRRGWWEDGFKKTIHLIESKLDFSENEYLVYSDNPFRLNCYHFFTIKDAKFSSM